MSGVIEFPQIEEVTAQILIARDELAHACNLIMAVQMMQDIGQDVLKFEVMYQDAYGRDKPCFYLPCHLDHRLEIVRGNLV